MAYDFDLHASLYRFVRDPSPQLREDRGKREVFHRAVCSWFRDVELREAGALLEVEVAEAGRQGIAVPEVATYVELV
ncbi:MAG: hypothetical protein R3F30_15575, partial [Planctomycetota bacterium]